LTLGELGARVAYEGRWREVQHMFQPTQGPSAGPVLLAVAALVAALASILLAAGAPGGSDKRVTAEAGVRGNAQESAKSDATKYERVEGSVRTLAPAGDPSGDDVGSSSALCPSGMRVVSGGYQAITGGGETFYSDALTSGRVGWAVGAVNNLATPGTVQAFAYCARSGKGAAGSRRTLARQRAAIRREMKALGERYRTLRAAQL
jgi:hypothetical protein